MIDEKKYLDQNGLTRVAATIETRYATKKDVAADIATRIPESDRNSFAPKTHTHSTADVTSLTGYSKGTTTTALATSDTLNTALGKLEAKVDSKAPSSHTHLYAGSATAGGSANSAVKLDTATAGSTTQPVYFSNGKPVAISYTIAKSVPSDAEFTNTWRPVVNNLTSTDTNSSLTAAQGKVLNDKFASYVPTARTINSKALSSDITLVASDVGAASSNHNHDSVYAEKSHTHTKDDITSVNASAISGVISSSNLPSYVDDVIEGYYKKEGDSSSYPEGFYETKNGIALITPETGKIYVDLDTNITYR